MRTTTGKDKVGAAAASLSGAAATAAALGSWLPAIEKTYGAAVTGSAPVATVNAAGNTTGTTRSAGRTRWSRGARSEVAFTPPMRAAVGFEVRLKEVVEKFTKSPAPERSFVAFQVFGMENMSR